MFPTKILVAADGSAEAIPAVRAAVELANGTGSELEIVHVVCTKLGPPYPTARSGWGVEDLLEYRRLRGLRVLEEQKRVIEELGGTVGAAHYREGKPEKEVVKLGRETKAGVIITGGHKRHWLERVFGRGFSTTVLHKADRPVLVVNESGVQGSTVPR